MLRRVKSPTPEELCSGYSDRLYRYCYRVCGGNATEAEDLAQETLLSALGSLNDFEGRSTVTHWLFTIALHEWLKRRRRPAPGPIDEDTPGEDQMAAAIE